MPPDAPIPAPATPDATAPEPSRSTYHHGDLRTALIQAADQLIAERGLEHFTLRAAARRAGVSPAAPAHHFGSVRGLLTEVALLAYERVARDLDQIPETPNLAQNVRALSLSFVRFAVQNPGHFRLMFRGDLVNRDDPRYAEASHRPGMRLGRAVTAYAGRPAHDLTPFTEASTMLGGIAALHGLAHLVLEGKAARFFPGADPATFLDHELPRILAHLYPDPLYPDRPTA